MENFTINNFKKCILGEPKKRPLVTYKLFGYFAECAKYGLKGDPSKHHRDSCSKFHLKDMAKTNFGQILTKKIPDTTNPSLGFLNNPNYCIEGKDCP